MSSTKRVRVSRVADWSGWCSPCESEDRPLVLTRTGPAGPGAWLAGLGDDDRFLLLTCNVCGHWQVVPPREEDDPEVVLVDDEVLEAVHQVVAQARAEQAPADLVVADHAPLQPAAAALNDAPDLELLHLLPTEVAAPPTLVAVAVPAPRSERRVVALPETLPAYSPEAVAAARRVLAAARAETQRTVVPRPAPLDRTRRTRSTASARRAERQAVVPPPPPAVVAAATAVAHAGARQLVLAAA